MIPSQETEKPFSVNTWGVWRTRALNVAKALGPCLREPLLKSKTLSYIGTGQTLHMAGASITASSTGRFTGVWITTQFFEGQPSWEVILAQR